jgi:GH15 family glucan-1,4-alpha-glucosidase
LFKTNALQTLGLMMAIAIEHKTPHQNFDNWTCTTRHKDDDTHSHSLDYFVYTSAKAQVKGKISFVSHFFLIQNLF